MMMMSTFHIAPPACLFTGAQNKRANVAYPAGAGKWRLRARARMQSLRDCQGDIEHINIPPSQSLAADVVSLPAGNK